MVRIRSRASLLSQLHRVKLTLDRLEKESSDFHQTEHYAAELHMISGLIGLLIHSLIYDPVRTI